MRPDVGTTTERMYARLPAFYREDDETDGDYPLLRFLSLVGDQASEVEDIVDRLPTDLANPIAAEAAWVPWLAQLVGLDTSFDPEEHRFALTWLFVEAKGTWDAFSTWNDFEYVVLPTAGASISELREAIANASLGWGVGTKKAIGAAAQSVLIGSRSVRVYDHSSNVSIGGATAWDVLIVTATSETPSPSAVLDAVTRKNAKPAGVVLWHRVYEASWDTLVAAFPTWTVFEGATPWDNLEETGV